MAWQQNFAYPWFGMHVHAVFCLFTFLGVVLFLIWAFRVLDKKKMFTWAISLLVIGLVGGLLTAELGGRGFEKMREGWEKKGPAAQTTPVAPAPAK